MDIFRGLMYLCPRCSADLTESLRGHLHTCPQLLPIVRKRAQDARDAARKLVKENHQSRDRADVLRLEAKAASAALREAMRQNFNWKG